MSEPATNEIQCYCCGDPVNRCCCGYDDHHKHMCKQQAEIERLREALEKMPCSCGRVPNEPFGDRFVKCNRCTVLGKGDGN